MLTRMELYNITQYFKFVLTKLLHKFFSLTFVNNTKYVQSLWVG